jgi:hypothetical protein
MFSAIMNFIFAVVMLGVFGIFYFERYRSTDDYITGLVALAIAILAVLAGISNL